MSEFDFLLHRKVKDGKQYEKLIPKSAGKKTYLGDGMTDFSITEMAKMVKQYAFQMEKVAPLLKKSSLQLTCKSIHEWCYDHFQYKADDETQLLRSPSYAFWYDRYKGIDCKSYSIIASCILTCLGIKHYIRKIKQPGYLPQLWTHVYVIVPTDQETGTLKKGYYVIDGTVDTMNESLYTETSDLDMSMQHYGLNGSFAQRNYQRGLGISYSELSKHLSLNNIKGLFSGGWKPNCIGGSLDTDDFYAALANIVPAFEKMIDDVNLAVNNGNDIFTKINKLLRVAAQMKSHSALKASGNWKSTCSKNAVDLYKAAGEYYYNIVYTGFLQWLQYYFDIQTSTVQVPNNTFDIEMKFDKGSDVAQIQATIVTKISPKAGTTNVKQFVITPYIGEPENQSNFNLQDFLGGINKVVAAFTPSNSGSGTGISSGSGISTGSGKNNNGTVAYTGSGVKTASMGGVLGFILFASGVAYIFSGMKDEPAAKPQSKTTTSK